jgi:hypothetical protein
MEIIYLDETKIKVAGYKTQLPYFNLPAANMEVVIFSVTSVEEYEIAKMLTDENGYYEFILELSKIPLGVYKVVFNGSGARQDYFPNGDYETFKIDGSNSITIKHNDTTDKQGGDGTNFYHSDQETNKDSSPTFNALQFDTTPVAPLVHTEGLVIWNPIEKTLDLPTEVPGVTNQVGRENCVRTCNETGAIISNGTVLYISGTSITNNLPTVTKARADEYDTSRIIGIATHDIPIGGCGYVTSFGIVGGLNTIGFAAGSLLYLSSTTAGVYTNVKPTAGNFLVTVAIITEENATTGKIFVYPKAQDYTVEVLQDLGWSQNGLATLSFNDSNRALTLTPVNANFYFYQYGNKYTKTSDTKQIPDEEGLFLFYYDLGVIQILKNPTDAQIDTIIRNNPTIAYIYWNAVDKKKEYIGYELHRIGMPADVHAYLHSIMRMRFFSGILPNSIIADASGDLNSHAQFGLDAGAVLDEDLYFSTPTQLSTNGLKIKYLSGTTANPVFRSQTKTGFNVLTAGTGRLAFNSLVAGNWTLSEVGNNDFVCYHLFVINDNVAIDRPFMFVGQTTYPTIAQAQAGAKVELTTLKTYGIIPNEIKVIATFIYQTGNTYLNSVKARIRSTDTGEKFVDWRFTYFGGSIATGGGGGSSNVFSDSLFQIFDSIDPTKTFQFEASGITTGSNRVLTVPNKNGTLAMLDDISNFQSISVTAGENLANREIVKIVDESTIRKAYRIMGRIIGVTNEFESSTTIYYTCSCSLNSAITVVAFRHVNSNVGTARVVTIDKTNQTVNAFGLTDFLPDATSLTSIAIETLNATQFLIAYNAGAFGCKIRIGTVTGTTITYGSTYDISANTGKSFTIKKIGTATFAVAWIDTAQNKLRMRVGTVSGTVISWITLEDVPNATISSSTNYPKLTLISDGVVILFWQDYINGVVSRSFEYLGGVVTWGFIKMIYKGSGNTAINAIAFDNERVIMSCINSSGVGYTGVGVIGGIGVNRTIYWEKVQNFSTAAVVTYLRMEKISEREFIIAYNLDNSSMSDIIEGKYMTGILIDKKIFFNSESTFNLTPPNRVTLNNLSLTILDDESYVMFYNPTGVTKGIATVIIDDRKKFAGIINTTANIGTVTSMETVGRVISGYSGLITGSLYYYNLTSSSSPKPITKIIDEWNLIGLAISSTELQIIKNVYSLQ